MPRKPTFLVPVQMPGTEGDCWCLKDRSSPVIGPLVALTDKGTPARESRTGTQLVSPAAGCEKKKRHLWNSASEH